MSSPPLTWNAEKLPDGVLRVAFAGRGGLGSDGNQDGERMREAIREVLAVHGPTALVIDLSGFTYTFGNWIGAVPLTALEALGAGRVCVLATGNTAGALHSLWALAKLDAVIPLFQELSGALAYMSESDTRG